MKCRRSAHRRKGAQLGTSFIELALVLPILLILVLGVVDFARAIQFNNILVSISREGANLAARSAETPPNIITALASTAEPLKMNPNGMVYLSQVVGKNVGQNVIQPQCLAQYRYNSGDTGLKSNLGCTCSRWTVSADRATATCSSFSNKVVSAGGLNYLTLLDGETVYAAEAMYNYDVLVGYVMKTAPLLYSLSIM